ncbi:MAG: hypothetical protein CME01_11285 [Geminicoccus sp.]|nr:hypothetical protein [Geminicoccus sp.]
MSTDNDELDLLRLISVFWRRKFLIIGIALPVIALGIGYALTATPYYRTTAKVLFEPSGSGLRGDLSQATNALRRMESEIQIARSEEITIAVIKDLGLATDSRFDRRGRSLDAIGDGLTGEGVSEEDAIRSLQRIRKQVERLITVTDVTRSTLLNFTAETPYPDLTAALSNSFAQNYIAAQIQSKVNSAFESLRVVNAAVVEAGENLEISQRNLSAYLIDNAQDISYEAGNIDIALLADDYEATKATVAQVVKDRERLNDILAQRQFEALEGEFTVSSSDDILLELQAQVYFDLAAQRKDLLDRRESQGSSTEIENKLASLEEEIAALANERLEQLAAEAAVQQERQSTIKSELEIEIFSADLPAEIASDLFKLQSDATSARDQYTNLVDRADELAVTARTQVADSRIVARATIPGAPAGPKREQIIAIAVGLGLLLGMGLALLADFVWGGLSGSDDLRALLGSRRYAIIPKKAGLDTGTVKTVLMDPFGPFAESLRMLRSEIEKGATDSERGGMSGIDAVPDTLSSPKIICVTSAVPKEGKSTTSIGLAVLSAMSGHKTCLIDFDFRRPSLSAYTGLEPNADLPAYLMEKTDGFMVQNLEVENTNGRLDVVTGAPTGQSFADQALASGRIQSLITELRDEYDMVIIDTAPVLAVAETQAIARYCDATVFCARENYAARRSIKQAYDSLLSAVYARGHPTIAMTFSRGGRNKYYYAYRSYASNA